MKRNASLILSCLLVASQLGFVSVAQARNTPTAPIKSLGSDIDFDQPGDLNPDDGSDLNYPTFDFGSEDIEVNVVQNIGVTSITTINIDLPSGFVVTGFDSDDTYIQAEVDGDPGDVDGDLNPIPSTICTTTNLSLNFSADGVTAKGFSCSDSDGTVNFRFDVDDVVGYITATAAGSYSIESHFRTAENRKFKPTAYTVKTNDLLVLSEPSDG